MKKTSIKKLIIFALIFAALALAACGGNTVNEPAPTDAVEPAPTPEPTPEPTPFVEPDFESAGALTVDGTELQSGAFIDNGIHYARLSEFVSAIGAELQHDSENESFSFDWRKDHVNISVKQNIVRYMDQDYVLEGYCTPCNGGNDLLIPLNSFCNSIQIGFLFDEEYEHIYCTPAAGDWDVAPGYDVPVMMYHGIGHGSPTANLFVNPEDMEKQIVWLLDNGYTPIWFEDLEHVEDYEKPIILTYDDGWRNNYTNLFPLAKKYNVKVTIFVVLDFIKEQGNHMSAEQLLEMHESGLVSMQSHTMSHRKLDEIPEAEQEMELAQSRLALTRMFGKEPCALSYPIGGSTEYTQELVREYYHFGVKMTSPTSYNTSDDPTLIYRFFPQKQTPMSEYTSWLTGTFGE